jgi:SAM-dependent methyltransferase
MKAIGPGRAHFEAVDAQDDRWTLSGWIFHPDVPTTAVAVEVDGAPLGEWAPLARDYVKQAFPWVGHADRSGFRFDVPRNPGRKRVRIEARAGGRALTNLRTTLSVEFEGLPLPPPELMRRVSGSPDPRFFDADAVRSHTEFVDAVARYGDWSSISRMLDWGCGCGRVTRCFLRAYPHLEIHGCDIDAEAVAWCSSNLGPGRFRATKPLPPTGYPEDSFELVLGYSVFSHLNPELQHAWLEEIRRILAPRGLFLASVNGHQVARFAFPPHAPQVSRKWYERWGRRSSAGLEAAGFIDGGEDAALDGVAPSGYYRGVYQSPEWTRREWSKHFKVLDVLEGGMQNYQDLVVLQKK